MVEQAQEAAALQITKRKRTRRHRPASSLSESPSEISNVGVSSSASWGYVEEEDLANCLILLAQGGRSEGAASPPSVGKSPAGLEAYKCKTCERSFGSFQALGGHRASHKKPKVSGEEPAIVKRNEEETNTTLSLQIPLNSGMEARGVMKGSKVHECSICSAEFSSGQALGGHMRRHRPFPTPGRLQRKKTSSNLSLTFDLNLPAEPDKDEERDEMFQFSSRKQTTVFSASPLVGCQ